MPDRGLHQRLRHADRRDPLRPLLLRALGAAGEREPAGERAAAPLSLVASRATGVDPGADALPRAASGRAARPLAPLAICKGENFRRRSLRAAVSPSRAKSRASAGARSQNRSLAPADKLKREIQAVLTDELAQDQYRIGQGRYDGFAYVAAEAYFHLAGGYDAGLLPMQLKYRGKSHWWLLDPDGRVIDLTLGPRETSKLPVSPRQAAAVPLHAGRDLAAGADGRGAGSRRPWLRATPATILGWPWSEAGGPMSDSTILPAGSAIGSIKSTNGSTRSTTGSPKSTTVRPSRSRVRPRSPGHPRAATVDLPPDDRDVRRLRQRPQRDSRSRRLIGVLSIEAGPAAECSPPTRQPPTAHSAPRGARWGLLD